MDQRTKRVGIIGGFTLMFLLLIGNFVATRSELTLQLNSQHWATHSRQVILELTQVQLLLRNAESGQRGYLYTGDPKYLLPYQDSVHNIEPDIQRLAQLTSDNQTQQARIATLRHLAAEKTTELGRTISLYQAGNPDAARSLVLSDFGLHIMTQIDGVVDQIADTEISLQRSRIQSYNRSVRHTILSLYLTTFLAAIGLFCLALYIFREMALRDLHARQLLEREEWFRVTLTSLGDAVIATDRNGSVTYVNPLAEQLIGMPLRDAVGRHIDVVFPIFNETTKAPVDSPIKKVIERGHIVGLANHTVLRSTSGALIPIEDSAAPIRDRDDNLIGVVLVFRDATKERKMQDVLRESEKLAAAARISASVAHEINNPLESVGNLVFLAKTTPNLNPSIVEYLELAEQELERVSHMAKQALGFYRESRTPERVQVPALIDYVLKLLNNRLHGKEIIVATKYEDCPPVFALPGELKQAISNLIANAVDAVDHGGQIWISLSCSEIEGQPTAHIDIEDDGPGVPPAHSRRIFEPFYTTKENTGTGLGLWVTKGIVQRYGGEIELRPSTRSGAHGAAFRINLPGAPPLAESAAGLDAIFEPNS
jgi:PAS domain S-box-containing protein